MHVFRQRPVCTGAILLVLIILAARCFGVSDQIPRALAAQSGKIISIRGRVAVSEETAYGQRLYLDHFSILDTGGEENNLPVARYRVGDGEDRRLYGPDHRNRVTVYLAGSGRYKGHSYNQNSLSDIKEKTQVSILSDGRDIASGDWVVLRGVGSLPERLTNPGQFDARQYALARKNVFIVKKAKLLDWQPGKKTVSAYLDSIRKKLGEGAEAAFGVKDAGLVKAIALGDRTEMDSEIKDLYQEGGIAHILAISSLHITLLCMGMYRMLRRFLSLRISCIAAACFAVLFCQMSGMSVSAIRALITFLLWLGSQMAGRTPDRLTFTAAAAILILTDSPAYLWDSSFLLSFGCILTLLLVLPAAQRLFYSKSRFIQSFVADAALSIGILPLNMYFFYQVAPYSFLVNLIVIPCMPVLMAASFAGSLLGLFWQDAGITAAAPCHYLLELFEFLCRIERKLPGGVLITGQPPLYRIFLYYLVLGVICILANHVPRKTPNKEKGGLTGMRVPFMVLLMASAVIFLGIKIRPGLRVTCLDVGQGDCILVETKSAAFFIDGGSSTHNNIWKYRMEAALKYYGRDRVDAVFVSHGDKNHISGIREMLEEYEDGQIAVEALILPDIETENDALAALKEAAWKQGIPVKRMGAGAKIQSDGLSLECLHPVSGVSLGKDNEDSMVLFLSWGEFTALFTGDLEGEGEQQVINRMKASKWQEQSEPEKESSHSDQSVHLNDTEDVNHPGEQNQSEKEPLTLLKVGHHGSKNGTSQELLSLLVPQYAVISCGKENRYGHPSQEVLDRLGEAGAKIWRTDQNGAVIFVAQE